MVAFLFLLIVFFACWGSFLNVLAYRLVRNQNIVFPPSACPKCNHRIRWYDNIPIFSWLFLKGKCRFCSNTISFLYPLIELFTVIVMTLLLLQVPAHYVAAYFVLFSALIVTIRSDIETMLISQYVTVLLLPIGFMCAFMNMLPISLWHSLMGCLFGYAFLWALANLFYVWTGKKGMGEGDFELLALIGSFLGINGAWMTLLIASVVGSCVGIFVIILTGASSSVKIPFGPFLAISAIICVLFHLV